MYGMHVCTKMYTYAHAACMLKNRVYLYVPCKKITSQFNNQPIKILGGGGGGALAHLAPPCLRPWEGWVKKEGGGAGPKERS